MVTKIESPYTEYLKKEDVKFIVSKHGTASASNVIESYNIRNASDKMLGFLCDYWKLKVCLGPHKKVNQYFLKLVSVSNAAKAEMVDQLKLFEKELYFYAEIKQRIRLPDLQDWSPKFITSLKNAMVFEDMNALLYTMRDKFQRFDLNHTLEALKTLCRFHASSIIYEDRKAKELGRKYCLLEDFDHQLGTAGYDLKNTWLEQCMIGCLEAIKQFSKYNDDEIKIIESRWSDVWSHALALADPSDEYRNVICHRDLWNNNFMFHYRKFGDGHEEPDHCVLIDFQAARYHPPAGDVMLLLYCNLDPIFREKHMDTFLKFYLENLNKILVRYGADVIDRDEFFRSAEKQRQWASVVYACLVPQFWLDDELTTKYFCDTEKFDDVLSKNKSSFIVNMMRSNPDYKDVTMNIFLEIVERYCLLRTK